MSSSWYHITRGRYFTDTKVVGIDFTGGLFDEDQSRSTLIHETTHAFLCNATEMGIFLHDVEESIGKIRQIKQNDKKKIIKQIFRSQQSAQEGFATFFQFGILRRNLTKAQQKYWLSRLPDKYKKWLKPFLFAFKLSKEEINLLTSHLIGLTMNTHIRKDAEKYKLLENYQNLKKYLLKPDNNPSRRLNIMLKTIKKNPGILMQSSNQIPQICGLKHFEPISNKDIVGFIKYLSKLAGNEVILSEDQIGKPLSVDQVFKHVQDNTIIANLNLNLAENGEFLFKKEDLLHYSDKLESVFISERGYRSQTNIDFLRPLFDDEPDISFIAQAKSGEKFLYLSSKKNTSEMLNNQLQQATLIVKWGDYNVSSDKIFWLPEGRSPNLVIFNHCWQMKNFLFKVLEDNLNIHLEYCNIGATEGHPFRTLLVKLKEKKPVLGLNVISPNQVDEVLKIIKERSQEMGIKFIKEHKKVINSYFIFWTGWDVRIDWVGTMLSGTELVFK